MRRSTFTLLRCAGLALACLAPLGFAHAQAAEPQSAPLSEAEDKALKRNEGRQNQKIERIRIDESNAQIDELRYGGKTQSITVKPPGNIPAYEVLPNSSGRSPEGAGKTGAGGTGPSVWNVLKF